ncbi:MAG: hypothetical protein HUJ98_12580, partial [Bacteroidaceae bacterium]|nr:hypothetical protein [Bacteroidaceae bacterium]
DIEEINCDFEYSEMTIVGNPGHTPFMDTVPYSYNIIYYNFVNAGWYGGEFIRGYTRPYLEYSDEEYSVEDLILERASSLYNIYTLPEAGRIVINFR